MANNNKQESDLTRAFICIDFPDEIIKEITRVQGAVGKVKFTGKLTEVENLHLTLKFLGEIDNKKLEDARERLKKIKFSEMELKLEKVGIFSYRGKPRIVWIKVAGKEIFELQKNIDSALKDLLSPEERFMSHLTIARVKYAKDKKGFEKYIDGIEVKKLKFKIDRFKLKSSELGKTGPVYKDIEVYEAEKRND